MKTTRRRFLKASLATTAACGLARLSIGKDAAAPGPIVDTQVYVGHWPHATLPGEDVSEFIATLRRETVSQAWVGSFDALFHKDIAGVNQRLADTCRQHGNGVLVPFGAINPTLPDWEEDVRRCHETFHMPGIRLHPNYHGYNLDDPRFARLLNLAATRGLIVQLVVCLKTEKYLWLNPRTRAVDLYSLAAVTDMPDLKLVIAGGIDALDNGLAGELSKKKNVYFDIACTGENSRHVSESPLRKLLHQVSSDRLLFGSGAPLYPVETALSKLAQANLIANDRQAIEKNSARKLLAMK